MVFRSKKVFTTFYLTISPWGGWRGSDTDAQPTALAIRNSVWTRISSRRWLISWWTRGESGQNNSASHKADKIETLATSKPAIIIWTSTTAGRRCWETEITNLLLTRRDSRAGKRPSLITWEIIQRRGILFENFYSQVHGKGLKFGTYLDYGEETCAGYPGSLNFLKEDAESLAEWEVDFIKMDGCAVSNDVIVDGYIRFADLMNKTGRPIV